MANLSFHVEEVSSERETIYRPIFPDLFLLPSFRKSIHHYALIGNSNLYLPFLI